MEKRSKFKSRKFWLGVAAFLASIGASISGIVTDNNIVVVAGIVCAVLSVGIYQALEATVDRASAIAIAQSNINADIKLDPELQTILNELTNEYEALQALQGIEAVPTSEESVEKVEDNSEEVTVMVEDKVIEEFKETVTEEVKEEVNEVTEEVVEKPKKKRGRPKKNAS